MIKASFNVIADMSGLDKFIKECIQLEKKQVSIGFDDTKHPDADMGMAELAWILEMGADEANIPPRNFMDSTNYQFGVDNMKKAPLAIKNILYKGISPEVALKSLGNAEKRLMKENMEIKLFTNPNNALSTIRRKGRDDALVETGLLKMLTAHSQMPVFIIMLVLILRMLLHNQLVTTTSSY